MLASIFYYDYFIENYHSIMFFLFYLPCEPPQEYHLTTISKAFMGYDWKIPSFTGVHTYVRILSGIDGTWDGQEYFWDYVV